MTTRSRALGLALATATTVVLWQFTAGRYLLYPITILATWFHEMGHGVCVEFLPYWFWAILLTGVTLWIPVWSFARSLRAAGRSS